HRAPTRRGSEAAGPGTERAERPAGEEGSVPRPHAGEGDGLRPRRAGAARQRPARRAVGPPGPERGGPDGSGAGWGRSGGAEPSARGGTGTLAPNGPSGSPVAAGFSLRKAQAKACGYGRSGWAFGFRLRSPDTPRGPSE